MPPLSLLFSSNEETSSQLRRALEELELHVEHCPEIFSAVEKLTSHTFDVIAVDWDEGAEASFLLKTAKELKSNQGAVTIAIVNDDATFPAAVFGVNVVLRKPVLSDEIKYSLLTCDEFLAGMRTWLARGEAANHAAPVSEEIQARQEFAARVANAAQLSPSPVSTEASFGDRLSKDDDDAELFGQSGIQSLFHSPRKVRPARKPQDISRFVLIAAASVTFLAAGYAFSQPTGHNPVALALVKTYDRAVQRAGKWMHKPVKDEDEANSGDEEAADYNPLNPPRNARNGKIRIVSVRHEAAQMQAAAEIPLEEMEPEAAPSQPSPHTNLLRVPESLKSPALGHGVENVAATIAASSRMVSGLQPVSLTQDFAEKLLLEKVLPSYPVQAVQARLQGPVVLQAWIGRDGAIRDLKLVHGSLLLGKAACDAVKRWRYRPYLMNGQAVEAQTFVTVDFRLPAEMEAVRR